MKLNKKWLSVAGASIVALLTACSPANDKVLTIGDYELSKDDFYHMMRDEVYSGDFTYGDIILEQHILKTILEDKYGDIVTEEYIDNEMERLISENGGQEAFDQMLEEQGITEESIRENKKSEALIMEAFKDFRSLEEGVIEEAYEEMIPVGRRIAHILVDDKATADEVIDKLNNGDDFTELVHEYSKDEGSIESDGEYTLVLDYFVPEFEEAALDLEKVGEYTDAVESDFGYHIIQLVSEGVKGTYEEEEDSLIALHYEQIMYEDQEAYGEIMNTLLQEYETDIEIHDDTLSDLVERILTEAEEMKKAAEEYERMMEEENFTEENTTEESEASVEEADEPVEETEGDVESQEEMNEIDE